MKNLKIVKDGYNSNGLMDVKQASKYLCLKTSSIYQLTMQRKIPFIKLGKRLRFKRCDLDCFIEQSKIEVNDFDS